jgi:hypothetical protein
VLTEHIEDLASVRSTYQKVFATEAGYRGLKASWHDGLLDTINACVCIMGKGTYERDEFPLFMKGIDAIKGHIFDGRYSGEIAAIQACTVMHMAAALLVDSPRLEPIVNVDDYRNASIDDARLGKLSYIRKLDLRGYARLVEAIRLLGNA